MFTCLKKFILHIYFTLSVAAKERQLLPVAVHVLGS